MRLSRLATARQAGGFSLIEMLVALVVLSVGLLGIAVLYVQSVQSGRVALVRTQAVALASDMADRIRANREGGAAYDDTVSGGGMISAACEQGGGSCPAAEMAAHDKALWLEAVEAALPVGAGTVVVNPLTLPATYTITVTWDEPGLGPQAYQVVFQT